MQKYWKLCLVTHLAGAHARSIVARQFDASDLYKNWPTYEELPLHKSFPTKAAWGVWGHEDEYGALNHITNETILSAAAEISEGIAVPINLQLDIPNPPPNPNRKPLNHLFQPGNGYTDDVVVMNTQISTQYDGLRHFPYSTNNSVSSYQWYNDLIDSYNDVIGPNPTTALGLQVAAQKGIAARGVLLDWAAWKAAYNEVFDAFSLVDITPAELDQVAKWQGLAKNWARPGDMLIIRTGWMNQYMKLNLTERTLFPLRGGLSVGMEASDASAKWFWEKKLSLVGADNPAFESRPMNKTIDNTPRSLHQIFLGGWGQSIVELLDLEVLAKELHNRRRSVFFITIQSLNIVSGIASPANALAIF